MHQPILIGVDGGGSRCRARARLADGTTLGEAEGGSANIFSELDGALATIVGVAEAALAAAGLDRSHLSRCRVGLGLAGANIPSLAREVERRPLPFAGHRVESDAFVACRGAHAGADGAIAIIGTGTAYVMRRGETFSHVGGWGFALSDQGGGAFLGRSALSAALLALDGIGPASGLTEAVLDRFRRDGAELALFGSAASPGDFGRFAPLVIERADEGDAVAESILLDGQRHVEAALERLLTLGAPSIALLGGLSPRYRPRLSPTLRRRIAEPLGDALDGALALAATLLPKTPA